MKIMSTKEKGISGWLSPQGDFIPADYGMHEETALQLENQNFVSPMSDTMSGSMPAHGERLLEILGYIKFTCRFTGVNDQESYVFFPQQFGCTKDVTDEQIEFISLNYNYMTDRQQKYIKQYLRYVYGITA